MCGQVSVFFGSDLGIEKELYGGDASLSFIGTSTARCGISLASVDVDADGKSDLFIGCDRAGGSYAGTGWVSVFMGGRLGLLGDHYIDPESYTGSDHYRIAGDIDRIGFGHAMGILPDIDGDGVPDLVVSAPTHEYGSLGWTGGGSGPQRGRIYVLSGALLDDETELSGADAITTIVGVHDDDRIGDSVVSAGDFTGDGIEDFWIGASLAAEDEAVPGLVYLMSGADIMEGAALDVNDAVLTFTGVSDGSYAGYFVAGRGDYNGDGKPDLFTVAGGVGEAYLMFGR